MKLRELDPNLTGAAAAAAVYLAARAIGVSKKGAAGFGAGALVVHNRMIDGMWPFKKAPPQKVKLTVIRTEIA